MKPVFFVSFFFILNGDYNNKLPASFKGCSSVSPFFYICGMHKIYHLGNCTTCQAIIKETKIKDKDFIMQDIKHEKITPVQIDEMKKLAENYESFFSRRAIKYRELGLTNKTLSEKDYRRFILDEYTFLKRPVVIIDDKIFAGSEKKTVAALKEAVSKLK